MFDNNGSFLLAMFEFFIFFSFFMALWWILGDVFRSTDLGGFGKTIWVLVLIILPVLGCLVYLLARGNGMTERSLESRREMQEAQADYIRTVAGNGQSSGTGAADQITSAKALLDAGTISQAEFDQLKAKALA